MRRVAVVLAAVTVLAGCSFPNVTSLPLPGGAATGDTYRVTAVFADASTLVVKGGVRVNDVPVGEVESISLTPDLKAKVVCELRTSVRLPANAVATIGSSSLLGENFVALAAPTDAVPLGRLRAGATIRDGTSTQPDTEQVLGALSAVLNGGSIGQAQVIVRELTTALRGRTGDARDLLGELSTLVGTLNTHRQTIVDALDGLDRLSTTLAAQHQKLGAALADLPAGIKILADERPRITRLLTAVARLGDVATRVVRASHDDILADLAAVKPVLTQLSTRGTEVATSLNYALTFPFGKDALTAFKGDYAGFYASLNLNVDDLGKLVSAAPVSVPATPTSGASSGASPGASSPGPAGSGALPVVTAPVTGLIGLLTGVLQP